jgi:hypothetical protein
MIFCRLTALVAVVLVALAAAATTAAAASPSLDSHGKRAGKTARKGGKVRTAWPRGNAGRPTAALQRWLARQVGPRKPRACAVKRRCAAARVLAKTDAGVTAATVIPGTSATNPLALVRSYDIPAGDPSYDRLLNWSWTYDSAVTAAAFAASGLPAQAERLLDQLGALQHTDGSIETAFNVYTGESSNEIRSGTVAWTGLAAVTYDAARNSTRYAAVATDAADWLLAQRDTNASSPTYGLVRGGPNVAWYSTQHNLIAYLLFTRLSTMTTSTTKALAYRNAAGAIGNAIEGRLLVQPSSSTAYLREGYGSDIRALDTQTLGTLVLLLRGQIASALKVRAYIDANFAVSNRSIAKSTVASTFNNAYSAAGQFTGYRPYADAGGPDVLWTEGTAQVRMLRSLLSESTTSLDGSIAAWDKVSAPAGPLQADRTVTSNAFNEYHVWPAAAPAAWRVLSTGPAGFFMPSYGSGGWGWGR